MNDLPVTLGQLAERLETLEQRVHLLEHHSDASVESDVPDPAASAVAEGLTATQTAGLFTVLGKAMLGIAGAYVLRAVAESAALPRTAVAGIAIAYAIMWLVWAIRVQSRALIPSPISSPIYAGTAAVMLVPMLWELTLTFNVLSPAAAAAILAVFALVPDLPAPDFLVSKRDPTPVLWITNLAAAIAALGLSAATREPIPFLVTLLLMALVSEYATIRNHARSIRPLVALAADLAIWRLIYIYSGPQTAHADYRPLNTASLLVPPCALFIIYVSSIVFRATLLGHTITVFETIQATISFALAALSTLSFAPQFGPLGLGVACLLLSAACYAMVLTVGRGWTAGRNYQVFAAWATALLLSGSMMCLPGFGLALCLGLTAIALTLLGIRLNRLMLQVHGVILLIAAAIASGLLEYAFQSMAGTLPLTLLPEARVVASCAFIGYWAVKPVPGETRIHEALRFIPAALVACVLTALLVRLLLSLVALRIVPEIQHVAFIRTFSICTVALALALAAVPWRRPECKVIAYTALAFVASKLIFEDLRHGHFEYIAASIFLFAISLMIVPRLASMRQKL